MPQINALNLAMTPRSLADINQVPVSNMPDVWQWQQNATQMDKTTLADMMRAAEEEAALGPGRLKRQEADLQSVLLGNQEKEQDIRGKKMNNELGEYLLPQKKITEWKKLVSDASDSDLKVAENEVYTMLKSPDPKVRAMGKQLEGGLKEAIKARLEGDQQIRVANVNNAASSARQRELFKHQMDLETIRTGKATAVAAINAEARKKAAEAGADPKKWQELAVQLQVKLQSEAAPEIRQELSTQIQFAQTMAERLAPPAAPQINPDVVGGGKLTPGRGPMPNPAGVNKPDPLGIR